MSSSNTSHLNQASKRRNTNRINDEANIPPKKNKTDTEEEKFSMDGIMTKKMHEMKREIEERFEELFQMLKSEIQNLSNDILVLKGMLQQNVSSPQQSPPIDITINNSNENAPKWIVAEEICIDLYNKTGKQIVQFINEYLPKICDWHEVFLEKIPYEKWQEIKAVVHHFWRILPENFDFSKELRKERLNQRFVRAEEIKEQLKNCDGLIISKNGKMFKCRWSHSQKKFLLLNAESEILGNSIWEYPKEIKNDDMFTIICKKEMKFYTVAMPSGKTTFLRNLFRN